MRQSDLAPLAAEPLQGPSLADALKAQPQKTPSSSPLMDIFKKKQPGAPSNYSQSKILQDNSQQALPASSNIDYLNS